jgi:hypothetical protein
VSVNTWAAAARLPPDEDIAMLGKLMLLVKYR